jgi:hypothetical protein
MKINERRTRVDKFVVILCDFLEDESDPLHIGTHYMNFIVHIHERIFYE